ncbi:hypothetical protein NPIL_209271 [Nephila pilipes]|uniref:Mos1 transposase HTH domain-containing protein n=1 Tax=Nephila pilipes TaxID=299642 RepID=A0A8X6P9V7_NEPPI|nr:hypothetical protein NPIL_209271 [Nephila pilipes]
MIHQVFGEDVMGVTQIKEWFNRFKDGHTSAEREQRCGMLQTARSAANVEMVQNLMMAFRRFTVREIAEEIGPNMELQPFANLSTLQIWLLATSGDYGAEHHSKRRLPEEFPALEGSVG